MVRSVVRATRAERTRAWVASARVACDRATRIFVGGDLVMNGDGLSSRERSFREAGDVEGPRAHVRTGTPACARQRPRALLARNGGRSTV